MSVIELTSLNFNLFFKLEAATIILNFLLNSSNVLGRSGHLRDSLDVNFVTKLSISLLNKSAYTFSTFSLLHGSLGS